ncbi:MAG: substrate-binding domain-containing protein [Anaerolineales bacterium]|nr:substrate-binding domain-containing protein [Anaerolineales bacterium]
MPNQTRKYLTIGVLAGQPVYGARLNHFYGLVYRGIHAAARRQGCSVLFACGVSTPDIIITSNLRPAWPEPSPDSYFLPVGPWNTDGLIVVMPLLSKARSRYVQSLIASGHPVVFAGPGQVGRSVVPDDSGGIHQAVGHLVEHGHRRIAFIAGLRDDEGDSAIRLHAYEAAMREHGLPVDPSLIVYGEYNFQAGRRAMHSLLNARRGDFTAVVASNDESAYGAIEAIREAGLRVPDDMAIVGFDDQVEARGTMPALTTIRHPMYEVGYQALELLLQTIAGQTAPDTVIRVPTRLVIRQSCGCLSPAERAAIWRPAEGVDLARTMAEAVSVEARYLSLDEICEMCRRLVDACGQSLVQNDAVPFRHALADIVQKVEALNDDLHAWQSAISILGSGLRVEGAVSDRLQGLLHLARIALDESARRQHSRYLIDEEWADDLTAKLTARLLTAMDEGEIVRILTQDLPTVGIRHAHVALFESEGDDPTAWSVLLNDPQTPAQRFPSRAFPPPGLYPADEPYMLALLPLAFQGREFTPGYVAFDAANGLSTHAAFIVHHLAVALRSIRLYREATEGRRLAEEADRLKSRFLSMVSHELRTPLSLIVGLSEMALRSPSPKKQSLPDALRRDLERIYASAQHLDGLIRDVLDLAQSELGQLRIAPEVLNLKEVLQVVLVAGEHLARNKGLRWQADIAANLPPVWGDRTRLRQVTLNLISNAVKFTAHGQVTLRAEASEGSVTISVSDTGPGIPPAEQKAVFDEFWQSEATAAQGYGGLGLGLAICKRLIELHKGEIGVRSPGDIGSGSTFYFRLPALTEPVEPALTAAREQVVLLLSERPEHTKRVRAHLAERGFEVEEHPLSTDWPSRLPMMRPGAVVLDSQLASERGWEIFKALKESPSTRDIPILFYSLAFEHDSGTALELDYLTKPVGTTELAEALKRQGLLAGEADAEKTILIVDDEPGIREMHARMVQGHAPGYRVLLAGNGREALAVVREQQVDLILLDLMMPEMDGFAVLEALRAGETTRDIPVIVLTAQVLTEAEMARLNRGVAAVLRKGVFTVEETLTRLEAALARSRRLGSEAQRLVRKAMAYLHTHYAEPLTREKVARYVGVSEDYLTRCFQQELGLPPMTYLTRYRMNQAKNLLARGDMSVADVAFAVGYTDSDYFSRVFRQEVGLTPSAYRRGKRV